MARLVEGAAHRGHVAGHARRGLVVDDQDGPQLMGRVGTEPLGHPTGGHAFAVGHLETVDLDAEGGGGPAEVVREVAVDDPEDAVARRQRVDHRRFPAARARARVQDRVPPLGLEHNPEPGQDLADQRRELRAAVVDDRLRHRPHDPLGDEGRAGDLQERPTGHGRLLPLGRARAPRVPGTRTPNPSTCVSGERPGLGARGGRRDRKSNRSTLLDDLVRAYPRWRPAF